MRAMRLLLFLSQIFAFTAGAVVAQSSATPAPPTFKASATNVLVDVVVSGHHGLPVEGLSQDSFTILENGHPRPIVSFEAHSPSNSPTQAPRTLPPGVYTNAQNVSGDDAVDVLLLDTLNTPNTGQVQSHMALLGYLKTLPVNKQVAVFILDTRLHQVEDFTTDHAALLKAVGLLNALPQKSPMVKTTGDKAADAKDEEDLIVIGQIMEKVHPGLGQMLVKDFRGLNAEHDSFSTSMRVQDTLAAFNQLALYLSGVSGRKNLIWLSGSFPLSILPNADLKNPYQASREFSAELDHTADLLASARVAVYPIDVRGLFPQPLTAPSIGGDSHSAVTDSADFSQQAQERLTLEVVAHETGGAAIQNTNDLNGALEEVDRAGARYYTLAYVPEISSQDNKPRRIEVRVRPGKYQLSYRRSYVPSVAPSSEKFFVTTLQHDVPASTQILFRLSPVRVDVQPENAPLAGSNPRVRRPVTRYSTGYDVDVAPLQLSPSSDGVLHGSATLVAIAYGRNGNALNSVSTTLNINVPSTQYPQFLKQGIHYRAQLDLPAQAAWLRAGIFDPASGRVGSLEVPISMPLSPSAH
jgi:VWFA-related protein